MTRLTMMSQRLSDEECLLLAFIRDHPGLTLLEIWARLRIDRFELTKVRKQLMNMKLIVRVESDLGPDFRVMYYPA